MQETISSASIWLELRLPAASIETGVFECLCESLGAAGWVFQTNAKTGYSEHVAWFAIGSDMQETRARIIVAALLSGISQADIQINDLGDDWETAWQKNWKAMPIGKRLWVRPSFCDLPTDHRIDIVLDPGMAFGTGQHATTQLCLEAIEHICAESMPDSMLDMGTGSGILAIAAAKLGIKHVLAIDTDPDAITACRNNALINNVHITSGLGGTPPSQQFDIVIANILAGPLVDMASTLAKCVGKHLVLSGLLQEQVKYVDFAYVEAGLTIVRTNTQEEWVAVELKP